MASAGNLKAGLPDRFMFHGKGLPTYESAWQLLL